MIKNKKDLYSGIMFVVIGGFFAIWGGVNYPMGSAVRMGPAYFPTILGALTVILGLMVAIRGFTTVDEPPTKIQWKILLMVLSSVMIFGLFVEPFKVGFVGGVFGCVMLAAYSGSDFNWKEALIESVVLCAVCWLGFVHYLGLPFRIFPWSS